MKVGRELDGLIAEKVMGWTYKTFPDGACPTVKHWHGPKDECLLPRYSIDIAAAWQVVEEMNNREIGMELYRFNSEAMPKAHECRFYEDSSGYWSASADTAPLAICLAALKAVGHKA